ncbi:unnamed protein product [Owenia fusiformis]|nr:unnamed protein product [Owenia fusiformis]
MSEQKQKSNKVSTSTDRIKAATLNVSCDNHANRMVENHGEQYNFKKRFDKQYDKLDSLGLDVIALQEIRLKENLDYMKDKMKDKYTVHYFKNNSSTMSFNNCLCIRKDSQWTKIDTKQYWTTLKDDIPALSKDPEARVPQIYEKEIKGDPHGRCMGVTVLQHKTSQRKILVASVQVVPFGETKAVQQKASLSLSGMARDITGEDCPVIIAGDFNIFNEDREGDTFEKIKEYANLNSLIEIPPKRLHIPSNGNKDDKIITDETKIGTFNPWSSDSYADVVYKQPLGYSKLDTIFASMSLECKEGVDVMPVSMDEGLNDPSNMSDEERKSHDELRYIFKDKLASDHFLLSATFTLK